MNNVEKVRMDEEKERRLYQSTRENEKAEHCVENIAGNPSIEK